MGLTIDGEYFSKSRDAGPHIPPSFPSEEYKQNYDNIKWDNNASRKPATTEGRRDGSSRKAR